MMEKLISVQIQTPYLTSGQITEKTEYIWLVCHGFGQLAKYFGRRFDVFDLEKHFFIMPQGLSRFYINEKYQDVGASWISKENREMDLENELNYLEKVFSAETKNVDLSKKKLILFGFSQGATMVARFAFYKKIPFDHLVLWAGGFPTEITKAQTEFTKADSDIHLIIGRQDHFYEHLRFDNQIKMASDHFKPPKTTIFEGKHEVKREVLYGIFEEKLGLKTK